MLPQPVVLTLNQDFIVSRADLIFCLCPICLNEVNWRHVDASYQLTAECCTLAMRSWPANRKMAMYRIEVKQANMKNVYWLHRKSPPNLDYEPPIFRS